MSLGRIAVETIRQLREVRDEARTWRELLAQALGILADRDRELTAARATCQHLRDELRRQRVTPSKQAPSKDVAA